MACSRSIPGRAVITLLVITSRTCLSSRRSKRRSRLVRIPTSRPSDTTGNPEIRKRSITATASPIFCSGLTVIGSTIIPVSYFLTVSTSAACSSIERFRWIKPIPPICAIAIAVRDSVTVSIGLDTSGMRSRILGVSASRDVAIRRQQVGRLRQQENVIEGKCFAEFLMRHKNNPPWVKKEPAGFPRAQIGLQFLYAVRLIRCAMSEINKPRPSDQYGSTAASRYQFCCAKKHDCPIVHTNEILPCSRARACRMVSDGAGHHLSIGNQRVDSERL